MWQRSSGCWEYEKGNGERYEKESVTERIVRNSNRDWIGYVITVMMSAFWGDGSYYPCVPAFVDAMGSEIRAVVVQTVLCGLVGMVYAAGSVVWEVDRWSLAGQTAAYFLITLGSVLPVAYAAYWMERSVAGVLGYVAIFCAIFAGIWIAQYLGWRAKINRINKKIALDK